MMTYKFLKTDTYGYNPETTAVIVESVFNYLSNDYKLNTFRFSLDSGCTNGVVNEYDEQSTYKNNIKVYYEDKIIARLSFNEIEPQCNIKYLNTYDLIQVTLVVFKGNTKEPTSPTYSLQSKVPIATNHAREEIYIFCLYLVEDSAIIPQSVAQKLSQIFEDSRVKLEEEVIEEKNKIRNQYLII